MAATAHASVRRHDREAACKLHFLSDIPRQGARQVRTVSSGCLVEAFSHNACGVAFSFICARGSRAPAESSPQKIVKVVTFNASKHVNNLHWRRGQLRPVSSVETYALEWRQPTPSQMLEGLYCPFFCVRSRHFATMIKKVLHCVQNKKPTYCWQCPLSQQQLHLKVLDGESEYRRNRLIIGCREMAHFGHEHPR